MKVKNYLSLIKFSHTIFAMPFALIGFFLAKHQLQKTFELTTFLLIILCMVFARTAAMAFNRYIDRDIDSLNPRTAIREIPSGIISPSNALFFVIINAGLFIGTTYFINDLCFKLSPVALAVILGYSYTKRFTWLCHLVLGLGLSLAPIGAYLASGGGFDLLPLLYSAAVLLWVAGFDIIYAMQDESFDKAQQLYSVPAYFGKSGALWISNLLHLGCAGIILTTALILTRNDQGFGPIYWMGVVVFIGLLLYQHLLVKPNDLSRVNLAFFTTNGIASILFSVFFILDIYL